ncbi:uncharacterized protein LOC115441053 isoform X2 [Manduca sexta]|uniref:uncharacterized protein LOC115441053 isoform X2 n=1 Tax=Manduca sexta TaxID=7130 RepID=UPI00188F51E1|nr:uncharacterized protein LOC115441053 isoform X2 [Manduca sexta]
MTLVLNQASKIRRQDSETRPSGPECPLLAKDSGWVDILQNNPASSSQSTDKSVEEVDCEDRPKMKPLAIMFPGLLQEDPQTLQGILNKAMSTTEVTKHLVDLGQKANFTFMKKANRLIPPEKQWLESVTETSNSFSSINSPSPNDCVSKRKERSKRNYDNADKLEENF